MNQNHQVEKQVNQEKDFILQHDIDKDFQLLIKAYHRIRQLENQNYELKSIIQENKSFKQPDQIIFDQIRAKNSSQISTQNLLNNQTKQNIFDQLKTKYPQNFIKNNEILEISTLINQHSEVSTFDHLNEKQKFQKDTKILEAKKFLSDQQFLLEHRSKDVYLSAYKKLKILSPTKIFKPNKSLQKNQVNYSQVQRELKKVENRNYKSIKHLTNSQGKYQHQMKQKYSNILSLNKFLNKRQSNNRVCKDEFSKYNKMLWNVQNKLFNKTYKNPNKLWIGSSSKDSTQGTWAYIDKDLVE